MSEHEQYRLLFDENPHPMWVYDAATLMFLDVNQRALERYGYTRQEFLAMSVLDLHPDPERETVHASSAGDRPRHRGLWRHRTKSGELMDVDVRANLIEWNGTAARLALAEDITERKRLEEQLHQAQKMDAVGQLAGGIAHDFNNLLTAMQGYSELLIDSLGADDPRRMEAEEINRASKRAAALTRQLLAFSRKQILDPRVLRMRDVVAEITPMLRRLIGETIELHSRYDDASLVKADQGQLEQVLVNLIVNARDAMPAGGRITIETADVVLDQEYARHHLGSRPGAYVMLAVADTGCGMDAATRSRVFEPFFTTKPKGKGTGLGLATVYGIVKQSDGYVWVYSEPGQGSTFKIYIPVTVDEEAVAAPHCSRRLDAVRGSETILVVEDEKFVRDFVSKVLRNKGYNVVSASTPEHALEWVAEQRAPVDLLVTDVVLPGENGRALGAQLQRLRPECRVLYMSGYTDAAIVNHGILEPDTWFLQKPFSPDALLQKVREVLSADCARAADAAALNDVPPRDGAQGGAARGL